MFDPSTATGTIVLQILAGIGLVAILASASWLMGPLKWPIQAYRIRKIILRDRGFLFVFNPEANKSKLVTFRAGGRIGKGRNDNEHSWRIKKGKLEIFAKDDKIYSRFRHDPVSGRLVHTNDPDTRSVHGQYFVPQLEKLDYGETDN